MTSLWPRIEPLLGKVGKPARYIGCEDGAQAPVHAPGKTSWLLVYPDTYEIGLPNQGLQILYEIVNERDDALAERAYAPWVDMTDAMRQAGGHCAFNPEPMADFVDVFVIGDGEEVVGEMTEVIGEWKRAGRPSREAVL